MHINGRPNGPRNVDRHQSAGAAPGLVVLRSGSPFADRIETFLHSACPLVWVVQLPGLLRQKGANQPMVACLIRDALDEEVWSSIATLRAHRAGMPLLLFLRNSTIPDVTRAMQLGVLDVLVEPIAHHDVMRAINGALDQSELAHRAVSARQPIIARYSALTTRQKDVLDLLVTGLPNRMVAAKLGISQKTVETHRRQIMAKMQVATFAELIAAMTMIKTPAVDISAARSAFSRSAVFPVHGSDNKQSQVLSHD